MSNAGKPKKVANSKGNLERWIKIVKNLLGECLYRLEVHPVTGTGDLVIIREVMGGRIPPSQNKEVRRLLRR